MTQELEDRIAALEQSIVELAPLPTRVEQLENEPQADAIAIAGGAGEGKEGKEGPAGPEGPRGAEGKEGKEGPEGKGGGLTGGALSVLAPATIASGGAFCEQVTISPNGKNVYVCNRETGNIRVYTRNPQTGLLTILQTLATGAAQPYGLTLIPFGASKEGAFAYLASQTTTKIYWYSVAANGELTKKGEVAAGEEMHCITISSDGAYLYAPSYKNKAVFQYKIEASGEPVALAPAKVENAGLANMHNVVLSPDGKFMYGGVGEAEGKIAILSRAPETGLLTYKETIGIGGGPGFTETVAISPDGTSIYAIQEGTPKGSIVVAARNTSSGALTIVEKIEVGLELKAACVSPDGANVYVTEQGGNKILEYTRNTETGQLSALATLEPGEGSVHPSWVAISRNGKYVYAAMRDSEKVAQLERKP